MTENVLKEKKELDKSRLRRIQLVIKGKKDFAQMQLEALATEERRDRYTKEA